MHILRTAGKRGSFAREYIGTVIAGDLEAVTVIFMGQQLFLCRLPRKLVDELDTCEIFHVFVAIKERPQDRFRMVGNVLQVCFNTADI